MARLPRLALAGHVHLVVLSAAHGQALFVDDTDRDDFLNSLGVALREQRCALHAYALLDTQVLLLATPASDDGLSRLIQAVGRRYVAAFNRRHGRRGSLWDGRFRATVVEPGPWTLDATLHVEGLAALAAGSAPSSAAHHLGLVHDPLLTVSGAYWQLGNTPFDREQTYRRRLADGVPADRASRLADASHRGWPVGSDTFIAGLAALTPRPLAPRPRGRPPKTPVAAAPR